MSQPDQPVVPQSDGSSVRLESRLAVAAEKRLGVPVRFIRWDLHRPTGASIPVFAVPIDALQPARALGLAVEAA